MDVDSCTFSDTITCIEPTPYQSVSKSLELYIKHRKPVLLSGPTGCGKSALLRYVAAKGGRFTAPEIIVIQLCKDVESKVALKPCFLKVSNHFFVLRNFWVPTTVQK